MKKTKVSVTRVYEYTSKCCNYSATKPPCIKTDKKDASLGTWTCQKCGRKCACNRHKRDISV